MKVKTLTYSFHGPINYENTDVILNLDLTVINSALNAKFTYTLEIPNHVNKTTHSFTLRK